ncbi:MAG: molybdenum cofactor guanylyltransferase [Magnetococcales bacterium]|nr:molybdenum cofactor guanylyltransferase [Magnetococcales bacterium]
MTRHDDTLGVILAGGSARRMQHREKALIELDGRPLLRHVQDRLAPQVSQVVISANGDPNRLAFSNSRVIADLRDDRPGPLAGMEAVMTAVDAPWYLFVPTDTPFLPRDLCTTLHHAAGDPATVAIAASGIHSHYAVGIWPRSALTAIQAALDAGSHALRDLLAEHPHRLGRFAISSTGIDPLFNINRPADLARADALLTPENRKVDRPMATLLYFAWIREKIGTASEQITLPDEVDTVAALMGFLRGRGDRYADALKGEQIRVAVNQVHAQPDDRIGNGDEIAIFPPVSGG